MMKMMKNCFCGMVNRQKAFSLGTLSEILTIANLRHAVELEPAQNLSSGFVE